MGSAHLGAHVDDFAAQAGVLALGCDDGTSNRVEPRLQRVIAQHATGARHGLVLPRPCGVAATLLLVVRVGGKAGHQQARIAVGPQCGINFVEVTFAGFDGQPIDELAHQRAVDLAGAIVVIVVHKHDVKVAAVAQLLAAQFAVRNDAKAVVWTVPVLQAFPAPARGGAQNAVGQRAEVIGDLFYREACPLRRVPRCETPRHGGRVAAG